MAIIYPDIENIRRLRVAPTEGEWALINFLKENLDDTYEVFFNPYLDGDRPDIIILKKDCAAFIVEVKDWDLSAYTINDKNKWEVYDGVKKSVIASPHSQAFRYKKNLYDLHLPVIGLAGLTNNAFYGLVSCFVYLHKAGKSEINKIYRPAEDSIRSDIQRLNSQYKEKQIEFTIYNKKMDSLSRIKSSIDRDKSISFGYDGLDRLAKRISDFKPNSIFDDNVYLDFKRRLGPPESVIKQGTKIPFSSEQKNLMESKDEKAKTKGVAGCGKTEILAHRAENAAKRHHANSYYPGVLILTFNITLKNHIRDKLSNIQGSRDFSRYEISNYHQFFNCQITNTGQDMRELLDRYGINALYDNNIFTEYGTVKYKTILIDEVQDYKSIWVKIIRDSFLEKDGEMVLFGDDSQDIYKRRSTRASVIAQGFGRWKELTKSYRTQAESPLNQLFKEFQTKFLIEKYPDSKVLDTMPFQAAIGFGLLSYKAAPKNDWEEYVFSEITSCISTNTLHPNDVVIIASKVWAIRRLNELFLRNENTHCMFESYDELCKFLKEEKNMLINLKEEELSSLISSKKEGIERIRRIKKSHFYSNSGLIKLSTTHSYKGLESKTVFYIMDEQDSVEIIYTSITRSTENLVILDIGKSNECSSFFENQIIN